MTCHKDVSPEISFSKTIWLCLALENPCQNGARITKAQALAVRPMMQLVVASQALDIEILHSVSGGVAPHRRSPIAAIKPAGQGSRSAFGRPELATVPFRSQPKASPFWIMLLLARRQFRPQMIKVRRVSRLPRICQLCANFRLPHRQAEAAQCRNRLHFEGQKRR